MEAGGAYCVFFICLCFIFFLGEPAACSYAALLGCERARDPRGSPFPCGGSRGSSVPRVELGGGEEPPASPGSSGTRARELRDRGTRAAPPGERRGAGAVPCTPRAGGKNPHREFPHHHPLHGTEGMEWGRDEESLKSFVFVLIFFFFLSFPSFAPSFPSLVLSVPAHSTLPPDPAIPALASPCH